MPTRTTTNKPANFPEAVKNYTEVISPNKKGYKLGVKNQRKLERIRELAARARGGR